MHKQNEKFSKKKKLSKNPQTEILDLKNTITQ